jgi:phosphoribosylformimino-5-aminoimidazole carboxamide ribotide isomerase
MFKVIPAIDLLNGNVVRLTQGDYNQVKHYDYTPAGLAKYYQDHKITRLHLVDLDGAKAGRLVNKKTLAEIRKAVDIELDFGGGVRNEETVQELLDLGINYVVLGSSLVKNTKESLQIIKKFPHKIIAGLDLKKNELAIEGWLEQSSLKLDDLLDYLNNMPVHSIIYTDVARDGMLIGTNLDGLKQMCGKTNLPIIASGGVGSLQDIKDVQHMEPLGVAGCIVGKALLDGSVNLADLSD